MANSKISALTSATTPLAGTETLPIVQSSATKQVSVANLTVGRSVSMADATLTTGNLVIGTSGKGIDFSATPGTGTSELLADYEEGVFTPIVVGTTTSGTATYTAQVGRYTKIGRMVSINIYVDYTGHTGTGNMQIQQLPFTAANVTNNYSTMNIFVNNLSLTALNYPQIYITPNSTIISMFQFPVGGTALSALPMDAAAGIIVTGQYEV